MSRLSDLNDVYDTLVAINFDFNTLPATNKYRKFYEWKTDPEKRKLDPASIQLQGERVLVGIKSFGKPFTELGYKVRYSGRADAAKTTVVNNGAVFGHEIDESAIIAGFGAKGGFRPAKAIFANKLANPVAVSAANNKITGRAYKRRTGETYTIPFGKTVAEDSEFGRQDVILVGANNHTVTFTPERLLRGER